MSMTNSEYMARVHRALTNKSLLCDWCARSAECTHCRTGVYHMHEKCYAEAFQSGYFSRLSPTRQQFPVGCSTGLVHFVLGYSNI